MGAGGALALHRGRFVPWAPSPVAALAGAPAAAGGAGDGAVLAVVRQCGAVEVWEGGAAGRPWGLARATPGASGQDHTCAAWLQAGARRCLVTAGLEGTLVEWDLGSLRPRQVEAPGGGAIWAMAAHPASRAPVVGDGGDGGGGSAGDGGNAGAAAPGFGAFEGQDLEGLAGVVALACDDGVVRVVGVYEDRMTVLARFGGGGAAGTGEEVRALSVDWHPSGEALFVGDSAGTLRCFQVRGGRELWHSEAGAGVPAATGSAGVGDGASGAGTCVWVVKSLPDGTIAAGNSLGQVQLFDTEHGALMQTVQAHRAGVLALAAVPRGDILFAAGSDCKVSMLQKQIWVDGENSAWQFVDKKQPHSHDVRALEVVPMGQGGALFSGGNDARLLSYRPRKFQKTHPTVVCSMPQQPHLELAPTAALAPRLLCQQKECVDVWQLGQAAAPGRGAPAKEGDLVPLETRPVHLARITKKGSEHIFCSSISSDGRWVAYSDVYETRLFQLADSLSNDGGAGGREGEPEDGAGGGAGMEVRPAELPVEVTSACCMCFAGEGADARLLLANFKGRLLVVRPGTAEVEHQFEMLPLLQSPGDSLAMPVSRMCVSPDAKTLAVVLQNRVVVLVDLTDHHTVGVLKSPQLITAVAFNAPATKVYVGTISQEQSLIVFDVTTCAPCRESRPHCEALSERVRLMKGRVSGFAPHPTQASSVVAFTESGFCHVDLSKPVKVPGSDSERKRKRSRNQLDVRCCLPGQNVRVLPLEDPCLHMSFLNGNAALIVECPWTRALQSVPEPIFRRRYAS